MALPNLHKTKHPTVGCWGYSLGLVQALWFIYSSHLFSVSYDHEIIQASQRPHKTRQTNHYLLKLSTNQNCTTEKIKGFICIKRTWLGTTFPPAVFCFCLGKQCSSVPDGLITGTQLESFLGLCSPDYSSASLKHTYSYKNKSAITRAAKPLL